MFNSSAIQTWGTHSRSSDAITSEFVYDEDFQIPELIALIH
jgi:hypothetical protein